MSYTQADADRIHRDVLEGFVEIRRLLARIREIAVAERARKHEAR